MKNTYKSKTMIFDAQSDGNCKIIDVVRNEKGEITTESKLNYLVNKLKESGNKLPESELIFIASHLLQLCNKMNKPVYDLEII